MSSSLFFPAQPAVAARLRGWRLNRGLALSLNTGESTGLLPRVEPGSGIPRVFYQTHSNPNLPDAMLRNREDILRRNPGWSLKFFDDAGRRDFILREYGSHILGYYDAIGQSYGAAKADLFRYLLIYKQGGVYLDVKSSSIKPLDDIVACANGYLLSTWSLADHSVQRWGEHPELKAADTPEFQQWHLVAAPGHRFLKRVVERVLFNIAHYVPELHGTGAYGVLRLTGPIAYSLAIAPLRDDSSRSVMTNEEAGLIYSVYDSVTAHRSVLSQHYSQCRAPIVHADVARRAIGIGYRAGRRLYRLLKPVSRVQQTA